MSFLQDNEMKMYLNKMNELLEQCSEQKKAITELRKNLQKQESLYLQNMNYLQNYFGKIHDALAKENFDDNTIKLSAEMFSKIINALSWLENNQVVEQGFLNAVMDDVKQQI
jgi:hypothetical protein